MTITGYKIFDEHWKPYKLYWYCKTKRYTCPGAFEEDVKPELHERGMHFYKNLLDCFKGHDYGVRCHIAKVEAYGDIDENETDCCTNKLRIIREISSEELWRVANKGVKNSGVGNIGDANSGHYNSGDVNAGNCNEGNYNTGYYNVGNNNTGFFNEGSFNTGNYNIGSVNTGYYNEGKCNTGDFNIGDHNAGDFNVGDYCTGCFNTVTPTMYMFNKPSTWTMEDWYDSKASRIFQSYPTSKYDYIPFAELDQAYKGIYKDVEITGGLLQYKETTKESRQKWWDNLSDNDKKEIKSLPNFDEGIFKEIIGIDVSITK